MARKATNKIIVGLQQALHHAQSKHEFLVEKDVPLPAWFEQKYPLAEMDVGDSFLVPDPSLADLRRLRAAVCHFGKRHERLYSVRKDPKKPGSYRCWRRE